MSPGKQKIITIIIVIYNWKLIIEQKYFFFLSSDKVNNGSVSFADSLV